MGTYYVKEDDTEPTLEATLKRPNGDAVDLTGASVDIRITEARGGSNVVNNSASVFDAANGVVQYSLQSGDTEENGRYRVEFEVEYSGGGVETYPNKGYHTLLVGRNMES